MRQGMRSGSCGSSVCGLLRLQRMPILLCMWSGLQEEGERVMVEENASEDVDRQEHIDEFEDKGAKLFFVSKIIQIAKFLNKLAITPIFTLMLAIAAFSGLLSEELSIILTILIYCIIIYDISPRLMKPLYGEFVELRWVRAMLIAYVLVIYLVLTSILSSGSLLYIPYSDSLSNIYFIFYFIIYMLFSILVTKIMLKKSDMVQWTEALPIFYDFAIPFSKEDIEEMKGVWRGKSNHPWLKRNVIRYVLPCSSGLIFTTVGLILGQLLWALDQCTVIFVIFVSVWLLNELYHLARKENN